MSQVNVGKEYKPLRFGWGSRVAVSRDKMRLEKFGFKVVKQKGSHIKLRKENSEKRTAIIPNHEEVAIGTLKSILRQAGISEEEFLNKYEDP